MKKNPKEKYPIWGPVVPIVLLICICLVLLLCDQIVYYFNLEPNMGMPFFVKYILGIFLTVTGLLFFIWGFTHLKPAGALGNAKSLRVTGPFALTRNPMYFGAISAFWGIGLYLDSLAVIMSAFIWTLINYSTVLFWEEKHTYSKFGKEYLAYKKRVPRFIPIKYKKKK